jgi:HD-like signal output (HDOD) protein
MDAPLGNKNIGIPTVDSMESAAESTDQLESLELISENADREIIKSIIEFVDQLPPLPMVVQKIMQLVQQEETSAQDLAKVISMDTALAAKVLRLVNSALYSVANPVTTIQRAVAILGFSELKNMTLGLKIMDTFANPEDGNMDRDEFWEHSLACGLCAQSLSENLRQVFPEEAFLGGLLHDVGKLVLDAYLPDQWKVVQDQAQGKQLPPLLLEEQIVGVPHTDVGQWLAERWKLPRLHQIAIKYHHEIPSESDLTSKERAYCGIICAANSLVQWLDLGSSGYSPLIELPEELCGQLGLSDRQLEHVLSKTVQEVRQWKKTFGLPDNEPTESDSRIPDEDTPSEPMRLLIISPQKQGIPSPQTLLASLGYEVHTLYWGGKIVDQVQQPTHDAIVMALGRARVNPQKFLGFLRATRSRTSAPILLLGATVPDLDTAQDLERLYHLTGVPHRGALRSILEEALELEGR